MKKLVAMMAVLVILGSMVCYAEDTGIQIISGPLQEEETVNLDDWKVDETAVIPGFGEITFFYADVKDGLYDFEDSGTYWKSGEEAEYLRLVIDILNTQTKAVDFYKLIGDVICTYEREGQIYQFAGWYRQYASYNSYPYRSKDNSFAIEPMYRGKYLIVVTLPNDAINGKGSLSVTFKIGDNEFTYHHRK